MAAEFNVPADTAVITSTFVVYDGLPVLEVTHEDDEEGGSSWQFHCGNGDYSMDKMLLVQLDTVIGVDSSILEISSLEMGKVARRQRIGGDWVITDA